MLAAFHATAARGPAVAEQGTCAALSGRWNSTFDQLRPFHGGVLDAAAACEVEHRTAAFVAGRGPLSEDRIAQGYMVDGHGDLIADDIFCLPDGPRALDCLEFDDRLRYLDALDDAAFLAMDIEHLGDALRHHYIAYRAFVRAEVGCLRHRQGDPAAAADVHAYTDLTLRHLRAGVVRLVLVGGTPATGKTTLAGRIADRLGGVALNSDRIRKELVGLPPETSAAASYQQGIYITEWTDRTYRELISRAGRLLERGETVVLDASWNAPRHRGLARELAAHTHSILHELRCTARPDVVTARLAHRSGGCSDADAAVAAAMSATARPWPDATEIVTDDDPDLAAQHAFAVIGVLPQGEPSPTKAASRSGRAGSRRLTPS